jgi:hypothetical protein
LLVALILATTGVAVLVLRPGAGSDSHGRTTGTAARTQAGLCATLRAATDDDVVEARTIFYDQSHDGLHALAARAAETDRGAAARLLEAKQRVEVLLDGTPRPAELAAAVDRLTHATAGAAEAVGEADVGGCDG